MRRLLLLLCSLLCVVSALPFSVSASDGYTYPEPEVLQIDLLLQPSRYLKMIHSEEKKKYPAVVWMNEGEPQQIGVQVRGDNSLREGIAMASKRIPLELCFDYADPNGTFRGNSSLKLINCKTPARLLAQFIAMQAFVFLDIPTPSVTPAFIRINDTDFGLYLAVEDLNKDFVQNHFGGDVSLYRQEDNPIGSSVFCFEENEMLAKVDCGGNTLAHYTEAKERGDNTEAFLDIDEILRFMACEAFLMNEDGFLLSNRNFYLADNHNKLQLLPWDEDEVFYVFRFLGNYQSLEKRFNSFFKELMKNTTYFAQYRQYIQILNDEFLDPDTFLPWLDRYIQALAPFFQRDQTILSQSNNILADLTTGKELYNGSYGNLPLTLKTYHYQASALFSGEKTSFSIPKDMRFESVNIYDKNDLERDHSIIFRVCSGYWRLRRQALWQNDGTAILVIGGSFALVFACTVFSVYRPAFRRRRKE